MADHYVLDLDPQVLRNVAKFLGEAEEHARTKGSQAAGTPDEIGSQWTGEAATAIKAEMKALGDAMSTGPKSFTKGMKDAGLALEGLAGHFDTAIEDLADLNTRWNNAQQAYDEAPIGDHNPDGDGPTAGETRDTKQGQTDLEFEQLKTWCRGKVKECGDVLATSSPISYYGYQGSTMGYGTNVDALLPLLTLTQQRAELLRQREESRQEAQDDVEEIQQLLEDREPFESQELRDALAALAEHADDPAYTQAFAEAGGAQLLQDAYDAAENDLATGGVEITQEDWEGPLQALNDVYASGMEQLDADDLGAITAELGNAKYIGILTAITASDHSGPRTKAAVFPFAHYMEELIPGGSAWDMTRRMSQIANDGASPEEIIQAYRDDMLEADELSELVNGMNGDDRDAWIAELLNDRGNPYDEDITKNWNEILPGLLEAARDGEDLNTLGDLLSAIDGYQPPADATYDLGDFFTDPKTIDLLVANPEALAGHQDVLASLFEKYVDKDDVEDLLQQIMERDATNDQGIEATARRLGYILGLAESAHVDFDLNGVLSSAATEALKTVTTAIAEGVLEKTPGLDIVISTLEALAAESAKEGEAREAFKDGWTAQALHQTMAWMLYVQRNGTPDSYEDWATAHAGDNGDPALDGSQYIAWLSRQPEGSDDYQLYLEIRGLQDEIGSSHE